MRFFYTPFIATVLLTLFRMGLYGSANKLGGAQKDHHLKICHAYLQILKLSIVMSYLKKIRIYDEKLFLYQEIQKTNNNK